MLYNWPLSSNWPHDRVLVNMSEEIYPLGRDGVESKRLNDQHKLLVDFVGGVIDSTIPLEYISSVADVATGTGIWLRDAQKLLNEKCPDPTRYFQGFDISAAQFPPLVEGIELSVQDIFQPFPAEHHNRYDLVHVRLLVTGIPESTYPAAVANLLTILKPGGYLQWVEIDWANPGTDDARVEPISETWKAFLALNNLSLSAPNALEKAATDAGLLNVVHRQFSPRIHKELVERAQKWQWEFFAGVFPAVMLKMGKAANMAEAGEKAGELLDGVRSFFDDGEIFDTRFGVVVGQKP
ncbi:hypothetical protein BDV18DRAFT_148107 [Aspergillus unguis]